MIITIDGPAGSGKSSVAKALAKKLGFLHLNSGLLYRAIAYLASHLKIPYENQAELVSLARLTKFDFVLDIGDFRTDIRLKYMGDGLEIDPKVLLSDEWSQGASKIATLEKVREILTQVQRDVGSNNNLVLEGRDSGSVVFPNADHKFYLDASLKERARRRLAQEHKDSDVLSLDKKEAEERILLEMSQRDDRDSSRKVSPQVIPKDAIVINTEHLSLEGVVAEILKFIN